MWSRRFAVVATLVLSAFLSSCGESGRSTSDALNNIAPHTFSGSGQLNNITPNVLAASSQVQSNNSEIIWRNDDGTVAIWLMNGATPAATPVVGKMPAAWKIINRGDFDGDGKSDIIWRNDDGTIAIWLMNGATPKATPVVGTMPAAWKIAATGDFDGDGKSDILWRNDDGTVALWLMNGATPKASPVIGTMSVAWQIASTGDFDGDGNDDILWRNNDGTIRIWLMNGTATKASLLVGTMPSSWKIAGAVDFDGDGKTDILWRNDDGTVAIWLMNGATPAATPVVGMMPAAWKIALSVGLASDPLLQNQWHIKNVGQNAFASVLPVAGNDMNVMGAWAAGYTGKGIKVGIADSGLEAAHEDLAANVDLGNSYNFLTGLNDPSPAASTPGFDHGTAVSGIIGAVAFNGKGGRGVAYNARLRGYNFLASGAQTLANMAKSLGSDPISADNDLFNASFGATAAALPTFGGAYQAIAVNSLSLRGGLGAAIVNAAGNDFKDWEYSPKTGLCNAANSYGVSCGDPANDERRGGYVPIIVGAIDADGKHSSYSNTGSSLWISAPGGEYGLNSSYTTGSNFAPAIITTSRTGCGNAPYGTAKVNALDAQGANPFAPNCQYTATMNGTSAATPNVAGVVAMMLEANPKLSVRDLKYILAKTAKKVDASFPGVSSTAIISGSTVVLEQGWVTNGAGWSFSNRYGFGAVDAAAAVAMAKSYTAYLPAVQNSTNHPFQAAPPATITPMSPSGNFAVIPVAEPFNTVEFVVVFLNIASTPGLICNQVELKSPSGTKSILMHAANGFVNASVVNSRFLSNAFYGEPVNGNWTLTFFDFCAASGTPTRLSTTSPQVLLIAGH